MARRRAFLVAGLFFGDESKGATVDYLVRTFDAHTVLRYNGGAQAAHNVVTPSGLEHCFAQFGAGMLVPGTKTYLSPFMFIDPLRMVSEYDVLADKGIRDAWDRLVIHAECPIVTPFHKFTGQMRELARGKYRYGSCGMGVGEAMNDFAENPQRCLQLADLFKAGVMRDKLLKLQKNKVAVAENILRYVCSSTEIAECAAEIRSPDRLERCLKSYSVFSEFPIRVDYGALLKGILAGPGTVVFEGAQGLLLDRKFGFGPYVTKSNCTFKNADYLLNGYKGTVTKLGVLRSYVTRHGNGPFVTEDENLTRLLPDSLKTENSWQGKFRIGWFDLVALRYAARVLGVLDGIAISHLDRIQDLDCIKVCVSYEASDGKVIRDLPTTGEHLTDVVSSCRPVYEVFTGGNAFEKFFDFVRQELPAPLAIVSRGPTHLDRKYVGDSGLAARSA